MKHAYTAGRALVAAAAMVSVLTLTAGPAQAAAEGELVGYPGPDGVLWIPEWTGSGGFVSGGLNAHLDTLITVACEGGGSIEVTFRLDEEPEARAPFSLTCPTGTPATVTVPLGTGLHGGFGAAVTTSSPSIRWGTAVIQPE
ncbi:hypothetical protein AB0B01_26835 [Streptomyces sp. NPDC044571]|uniref:hypothetical protein n=1 Tax=Streptomyces sp. NPDC044571 TaxID=3155371 RepID=UPI0033F28041